MALINFLASFAGRMVRVAAGTVLVAIGLLGLDGTAGVIVTVIGLVPLLAGTLDVCVAAPLFGAPFSGRRIRRQQLPEKLAEEPTEEVAAEGLAEEPVEEVVTEELAEEVATEELAEETPEEPTDA
jgi:hypothetical protein